MVSFEIKSICPHSLTMMPATVMDKRQWYHRTSTIWALPEASTSVWSQGLEHRRGKEQPEGAGTVGVGGHLGQGLQRQERSDGAQNSMYEGKQVWELRMGQAECRKGSSWVKGKIGATRPGALKVTLGIYLEIYGEGPGQQPVKESSLGQRAGNRPSVLWTWAVQCSSH